MDSSHEAPDPKQLKDPFRALTHHGSSRTGQESTNQHTPAEGLWSWRSFRPWEVPWMCGVVTPGMGDEEEERDAELQPHFCCHQC